MTIPYHLRFPSCRITFMDAWKKKQRTSLIVNINSCRKSQLINYAIINDALDKYYFDNTNEKYSVEYENDPVFKSRRFPMVMHLLTKIPGPQQQIEKKCFIIAHILTEYKKDSEFIKAINCCVCTVKLHTSIPNFMYKLASVESLVKYIEEESN